MKWTYRYLNNSIFDMKETDFVVHIERIIMVETTFKWHNNSISAKHLLWTHLRLWFFMSYYFAAQYSFSPRSPPKQKVGFLGMVYHWPADHRECHILVWDHSWYNCTSFVIWQADENFSSSWNRSLEANIHWKQLLINFIAIEILC